MNEIQTLRRKIELRKQALPIILREVRAEFAKKNRCDAQIAVVHTIKADLEAKIDRNCSDHRLSHLIEATDIILENFHDAVFPK